MRLGTAKRPYWLYFSRNKRYCDIIITISYPSNEYRYFSVLEKPWFFVHVVKNFAPLSHPLKCNVPFQIAPESIRNRFPEVFLGKEISTWSG